MSITLFARVVATLLVSVAFLSACTDTTTSTKAPKGIYKVGSPYEIDGKWYYPHEDFSYDETGIASWYGQDFHGGATSNGEMFNKNELTAAHKTLPLPSLARVTNLENGRSIVVRINDRGPFSGARIIDVSQRAAQLLGFEQKGTAEVRVQVLADESKAIADAMRHYGAGAGSRVASNAAGPEAPTPAEIEIGANVSMGPEAAAITPVTEEALPPPVSPVKVKVLEPVTTTTAVHEELLETKPVAEIVQLPVTPHAIYVQAGAFTLRENAVKLQNQLVNLGPSTVGEAVVNGTRFFRVRLGPIPDVAHADALLARVKNSGVVGARTVVD